MKRIAAAYILVSIGSILVLGKTDIAALYDQLNQQPTAEAIPWEESTNRSQMLQKSFSEHKSVESGAKKHRRMASPTSDIDFAPVVDYGSGGLFTFSVAVADVNGDNK